jgi:hypothetical protein
MAVVTCGIRIIVTNTENLSMVRIAMHCRARYIYKEGE